jgi:signal transduction histidine kinase
LLLCYMFIMKIKGTETELVHLLGLLVALWLSYLLVLAGIDYSFYPRPVFGLPFYLINGLDALLVLGLSLLPSSRIWFGRCFLPLIIVLLSVVPIVSGNLAVLGMPPTPAGNPEAIMLRLLPMMFMALVLTAWQYRWKHVVFFTLGMAGFNLTLHGWFYRPGGAPFLPPMTAFLIQTVSFLLVGYFISTLMSRLRAQNVSLEQANAQLVHYSSTLEQLTISRERNRLARELHDTLAHTLSALSVQLETAKAYFDVDSGATKELIDKSLQATRSGLLETRRALKELRASPLDDLGLLLALRKMAEEFSARAKFKLHLSLPDQLESLSPDVEQAVYRVAQEALTNAGHHANAQNLTLELATNDGRLTLTVADDGLGFDVEQGEVAGRFGLPGMRERAQLVSGQLTIESRPGQGSRIKLTVMNEQIVHPQ